MDKVFILGGGYGYRSPRNRSLDNQHICRSHFKWRATFGDCGSRGEVSPCLGGG